MADGFSGWSEDFQRFFIGLELDNSKRYFEANRKTYLERVRRPLELLLLELEPEFGKGKLFRPNRDVRFSADKSPYKTNIAATVSGGGYLSLDARGLMVGAGHYELDKPSLEAYRKAVDQDRSGAELQGIVEKLEQAGYQVAGEELKRVPPGFPPDHPRARLLRHKRLYAWRRLGLEPWLGTPRAKDRIVAAWLDMAPLDTWFGRILG